MAKFKSDELDLGFTKALRLVKPALFEPQKRIDETGKVDESSAPQYGAMFALTVDHPELNTIYQYLIGKVQAEFPGTTLSNGMPVGVRIPLFSGDAFAAEKPGSEWRQSLRGLWLVRTGYGALTKEGAMRKPPSLAAMINGAMTNLPFDDSRKEYREMFYGGVECQAVVGVGVYNSPLVGKGVKFYLRGVSSEGVGERVQAWCSDMTGGVSMADRHNKHLGKVQPQGTPFAPAVPVTPIPAPSTGGFPNVTI